jgi:hypothetical protein
MKTEFFTEFWGVKLDFWWLKRYTGVGKEIFKCLGQYLLVVGPRRKRPKWKMIQQCKWFFKIKY